MLAEYWDVTLVMNYIKLYATGSELTRKGRRREEARARERDKQDKEEIGKEGR